MIRRDGRGARIEDGAGGQAMDPGLDRAIDAALAAALAPRSEERAPERGARRLERLFADLARTPSRDRAGEIEALIWALWTNHADASLDAAMAAANEALAQSRHAQARDLLDGLVAAAPGWAEAWNKRAVLAFVEGRDTDSLADIARTLALEPRHFGAAAGLGQICLRRDRHREALAAFEVALRINPHLGGVARAAAALRRAMGATKLN
jgi:tetratricopeptide (TPR) repeat protein